MNEPSWIPIATAIGTLATPILILFLTAIGRGVQTRLERRMDQEEKLRERQIESQDKLRERQLELEDKLREDRIVTYNEILEPFIILFTSDAAWQADPKNRGSDKNQIAMQKMLSLEYRQQGFKMSLVGSDAVVESYNDLMQYFFHREETAASRDDVREMLALLGRFLLEIRRSMGNEVTRLSNWAMLEWFMKEARELGREHESQLRD